MALRTNGGTTMNATSIVNPRLLSALGAAALGLAAFVGLGSSQADAASRPLPVLMVLADQQDFYLSDTSAASSFSWGVEREMKSDPATLNSAVITYTGLE
jgi:hypothetical protein